MGRLVGRRPDLRPDLDAIEALSTEREALWTRIEKSTFLTQNEKRSAVGYGPVAGGDEIKAGLLQPPTGSPSPSRWKRAFGTTRGGAREGWGFSAQPYRTASVTIAGAMPHHLSPCLAALRAELAGHAVMLAAIRLQLLLRKANFNPAQLRDAFGRWTEDGGEDGLVHEVSRRPRGVAGTPAQEAQFAAAWVRALAARRRLRELDPTWRPPQSAHPPGSIEGQIRHQEGVARAAEARFAEILRDAIPNTNPSWGINRLRGELNDQGYIFSQPARGSGIYSCESPHS